MTAVSRFRCSARSAPIVAAGLLAAVMVGPVWAGEPPLQPGPVVWYEDDARPVPLPKEFEPPQIVSEVRATVSRPVARALDPARWISGDDGPAWNPNALGEVPNSSWFTNRMGLRQLSADELATGPGRNGPSREGPWEIIGAKTGGVSMGFRIRDAEGQVWLLKFDPVQHPGQNIRAGVVSNLLLHACGYNTPVDRLVEFTSDQLSVSVEASLRSVRGQGGDVKLTAANLDSVLQATGSVFDGRYHALASRYLSGRPLGPVRHKGTRPDDPNDRVPHEHRREWRALRVMASWIGHVDTKMQNTLAMYEGEPGAGHVVHYLIDFATTLGSSGAEPFAKFNYEYGVDLPASVTRLANLGLARDIWQTVSFPDHLPEVGYFTADRYDPRLWSPIYPNAAFANLTREDGYWAAKVVSAFTDDDLRVMVEQGRYQNPAAVDWLVTHLGRRRDAIARVWFDQVPPLDFWQVRGGRLVGRDLAVERGVAAGEVSRYRHRRRLVRADRGSDLAWSAWQDSKGLEAGAPPILGGPGDHDFRAFQWQVRRDGEWSEPVTVYTELDLSGVVAVDR